MQLLSEAVQLLLVSFCKMGPQPQPSSRSFSWMLKSVNSSDLLHQLYLFSLVYLFRLQDFLNHSTHCVWECQMTQTGRYIQLMISLQSKRRVLLSTHPLPQHSLCPRKKVKVLYQSSNHANLLVDSYLHIWSLYEALWCEELCFFRHNLIAISYITGIEIYYDVPTAVHKDLFVIGQTFSLLEKNI